MAFAGLCDHWNSPLILAFYGHFLCHCCFWSWVPVPQSEFLEQFHRRHSFMWIVLCWPWFGLYDNRGVSFTTMDTFLGFLLLTFLDLASFVFFIGRLLCRWLHLMFAQCLVCLLVLLVGFPATSRVSASHPQSSLISCGRCGLGPG